MTPEFLLRLRQFGKMNFLKKEALKVCRRGWWGGKGEERLRLEPLGVGLGEGPLGRGRGEGPLGLGLGEEGR